MTATPRPTGPVVIKLGGALIEPDRVGATSRVLAGAVRSLAGASGAVVLHGGGGRVSAALEAAGHTPVLRDGIRVTPPEQIGIVAEMLGTTINAELCAALDGLGVRVRGLPISHAGTVGVRPLDPGAGYGRVADAVAGDPGFLVGVLTDGLLPVLSCVGILGDQPWNINADVAAGAVGATLNARAVVFVSDVPGVLDSRGDRIAVIDDREAGGLIDEGVISGGMVAKVRAALRAVSIAGTDAVITDLAGLPGILTHLRDAPDRPADTAPDTPLDTPPGTRLIPAGSNARQKASQP